MFAQRSLSFIISAERARRKPARRAGIHAVTFAQHTPAQTEPPQMRGQNSAGIRIWLSQPFVSIHYSLFPTHFYFHTFRASSILAPSFSRGNAGRDGGSAGRNRRLRHAANVAAWPGRFRPRVPPRALRPACAGRAHRPWPASARMPEPELRRSGTGGIRNRRRGAGSRHVLKLGRLGPAPRFPTSPTAAGSAL